MSVARKYRLFCQTFQSFPGLFSIFQRELSQSGNDGGSFSVSHLVTPSSTSRKSQAADISTSKSLKTLSETSSSAQSVASASYSTSNPIIPDSTFPLPGNIALSDELQNLIFEATQLRTMNQNPGLRPTGHKILSNNSQLGYSDEDLTSELFSFQGTSAVPVEESRIITIEKMIKVLQASRSEFGVRSPLDFSELQQVIYNYHEQPIEVCTFACPDFIKQQLRPLFPVESGLMKRNIILINLSHQTVNDMSGWNEDVESERENLVQKFIHGAQLICEYLKLQNYFADFIDPLNGKPFYSPHTNCSLFETDELYEKFGFRIDDLGCCKVVYHGEFGTHVFVGTILTDAPLSEKFLARQN